MHPIFVLVTSEGCPACSSFLSNVWPELKSRLSSAPVSEVLHMQADSVPRDIAKYVGWYPTILLFSYQSWHSSEQPQGEVFGGFFDGDKVELGDFRPTTDNVIEWVKECASRLTSSSKAPKRKYLFQEIV